MDSFLTKTQSDCPDSTIKMIFMLMLMGPDKLQVYMKGLPILKENRPEVAKEFDFDSVVKDKTIPDEKAEAIVMIHICSLGELVEVGAQNRINKALEMLSEHRPTLHERMMP